MLHIVTLAYRDQPVAALQTDGSIEARRQHLFAAYIDRMFRHRNPATRYPREQTLPWLAWLARQMMQRSQTVFYIERLQPDWLPDLSKWRLAYGLGIGLLCGLLGGLGNALVSGLFVELGDRLGNGLFAGLVIGLVTGLQFIFRSGPLEEIETKTVSNRGIKRSARHTLFFALVGGLLGGLLFGLSGALVSGGDAVLRHFVLRFLLVRNGSAPWNYPAFLDVAAEYLFLRKVGGGYQFFHLMLRDYFAELPEAGKRKL